MYDLLIKGVRVIDPSENIDGKLDIAVTDGKIATVSKDIPKREGRQVIDAKDRLVTPGLIDLHSHPAGDIIPISIDPDVAGVNQGVTTVVDAGSTGEALIHGFARYVIPSSRTRVFCFLHLASQGISIMPELRDWSEINLEAIASAIESYRELIKGIKLRVLGKLVVANGIKIVEMAKKAAGQFGLPVMIHIGDYDKQISPTLTQETLPILEPGDIISHVFTSQLGGILRPDGTVLPELREAMARGVILDAALGDNNFNHEVARKCIAQGILPTTLSTDLGARNYVERVYGMTVTMSKFLALGLDLKQVVEMSTINPARALGEERIIGGFKPGMEADISIMEILSGKWKLEDTDQQTMEVDSLIVPRVTVKAGEVIPAQPSAQPKPMD